MTLPGHDGGCPLPPGTEPTVAALTDLLVAELAKRGIRTAHLVGNSLGGWLALELARRGVARSVVVFSPAGAWSTPHDYAKVARSFRVLFALVPIVIAATTWFLRSASLRRMLSRLTMEHGNRIPAANFRAMLRAVARTRMLPRLLETMGRDGPIEPLAAGCVPIRVVWGEQDQVIPFERYGRPMVERIAEVERMILPGVGHVPMYDDPEAVSAAILQVTAAVDAR
jgi:pimeloyl-ACP methyl ester carboxylesterase